MLDSTLEYFLPGCFRGCVSKCAQQPRLTTAVCEPACTERRVALSMMTRGGTDGKSLPFCLVGFLCSEAAAAAEKSTFREKNKWEGGGGGGRVKLVARVHK